MFRHAALASVFAGLLASSWAAETVAAPKDAACIERGCELYATHCASCHGTRGKGDGHATYVLPRRPKDFTNPDNLFSEDSDEDLLEVITYGKRSMPKYSKMLTQKERLQVIAYLRTMIPKVVPKSGG